MLSALLLLAGACGVGVGQKRPARPWNVLLVTFDTTRADRIGCYGNDAVETPTLDGLARDGVRFARALSAVPITAPSHSTIITGRYPIAHGVRDNGLFVLGDDQVTLAEILRDHGYATAAAIGAYPLISRFGLDQGFELFDDHLTGIYEDYRGQRTVPKERMFFDERRAAQVNEAILPWLEERSRDRDDKPFFAWVHYFDAHQPFEPAPPYDQLYADDLYNGEIAYADSRLGFLLERLEALGELDRTLVVMTADHGEGLGEHGEITHAILAYNATLHVPLIIRPPGEFPARGTVVDRWVGTVDVVPTILELLGIEAPDTVQGHSLTPLWTEGGHASRWTSVRYAENLSTRLSHGWGELRVLFEGSMKYIHGPRPELYDLDADPDELHDLSEERPDEARRMRDHLEAFLGRWAVEGVSSTEAIDDEVRRRLESLGYLHAAGEAAGEVVVERLRSDGVAPQDRAGNVSNLSAAKQLIFDGRGGDALPYTRKLLSLDPERSLYLELHAAALIQGGHLEEAWAVSERLASEGTLSPPLMLLLTGSQFERGDRRAAFASLQSYQGAHPSAQGAWVLATFHKRLGELPEARAALDEALKLNPELAPARVDLGVWLAQAGDAEAAERELLRALRDAPYYPKACYNYGTFLLHDGRYEDAAAYFRRAVSLAPRYLEAHAALVAAYLADEQRGQAEEAYRTLERMAPGSTEAATASEMLAAP